MNKEERKQYNHQYYVRNKAKITASKKSKGSKPYNYLTESHRRASRSYYWRIKERMTPQEHSDLLVKRRECYHKCKKLAKVIKGSP